MTHSDTQTALVTGASSGIGAQLARQFATDGYDVVLTARRRARLETLAEDLESTHGVSASVYTADLADPDAPAALADELADAEIEIDALVNNAGFSSHGRFDQTSLSTDLDMIQVNLVALTELTKRFAKPMVERGHGEILNTASMAAMAPTPKLAVYAATKSYVLSFTEAIADELEAAGVTVSALCPGPVDTELVSLDGMDGSGAADQRLNDPESVARAGYRGLKNGKRIIVPSMRMKALAQATRVLPRNRVVSIAGSFYD
ncbi:SDR family oxidoreductase [Haloferax larsenii]|uniref:SDR family oxidoreductase n=1 Tax=Haloferax larsenii TaxID=302484 RepID=A0ABY5REC9_HALLR|nr:SDR family oxidoreductase [Haloferax larsenii]UVE50699.1 SDR family oxidoreductase [Haloferax larsenii]